MAAEAFDLPHSEAVAALGWALIHTVWQGACATAAAALILRLMRRSAATTRYAVAYGALLAVPAAFTATAARTLAHGPSISFLPLPLEFLAPLVPWLAGAWSIGVVAATIRLIGGWLRLRGVRSNAIPAAGHWQNAIASMAERFGIARAVNVVESSAIDAPGVVGWLSPMILFPAGALTGLTARQVELIIAHELAHIRRHDYLMNLIQTAIETVFFYHPGVWWLSRRIRLEREHCCDDMVVAEFADRRSYAEALTAIERFRARAPFDFALAAGGGDLLARITRLIDGQTCNAAPATPWFIGVATFVAMLAVTSLGVASSGISAAAAVVPSVWLGVALGLAVGVRHAFEPDHLVAISTLVSGERNALQGARLGLSWGLGHTLTLFLAGSGLALVRVNMPERAAQGFEVIVAVMLIWLGVRALRSAFVLGTIGPATAHAHGDMVHQHAASTEHVHLGSLALARRPLVVGMVHGLAGSGALAALVMTTMPSISAQVAFILLFGLGSTIGMALLSGFAGLPLRCLARRPGALAWTSGAAGVVSMVAGVAWGGPLILTWL